MKDNQPRATYDNGVVRLEYEGKTTVVPGVTLLKELGFRVYVSHYRYPWYMDVAPSRREIKGDKTFIERRAREIGVSPLGGITKVMLLSPTGRWSEAEARCSRSDGFNRRAGYVMAVRKAISKLPSLVSDTVWEGTFARASQTNAASE